jgi:hypothetical protein
MAHTDRGPVHAGVEAARRVTRRARFQLSALMGTGEVDNQIPDVSPDVEHRTGAQPLVRLDHGTSYRTTEPVAAPDDEQT